MLIFRYFRKVVQDSEERIPRYKQSIIVSFIVLKPPLRVEESKADLVGTQTSSGFITANKRNVFSTRYVPYSLFPTIHFNDIIIVHESESDRENEE